MAIIWAESFDLYGTSKAAFELRGYEVDAETSFTTTARTGLRALLMSGATNDQFLRKVLDSAVTTLGIGCGIRLNSVATSDTNIPGFKVGNVLIGINSNFGISVVTGGSVVAASANNVFVIGSFFWVESKWISNGDGTGDVECRVNGETVVVATGISMATAFSEWRYQQGNNSSTTIIDDLVVWDTSGSLYNDFVGDRRCFTSFPSADTATEQWTPSTGTDSFDLINDATPNDSTYIDAETNGDISEFEKDAIGINTNDVAAVVLIARALKPDTGTTAFRLGINSAGFVANSDRKLPNTTVVYFQHIVEQNPNGGISWTKAAVDAANIRLTRDDP